MNGEKPYTDLNTYFRRLFGVRVHKITVDAGLSCPNRDGSISTGGCIYCNARGSGTGAYNKGLSITDQIETGKAAVAKRFKAKKFIAYFQSFTNTYAPVPHLKKLYEEALSVKDVVGLSIGTRPDCVDEPVLDLLTGFAKDHLVWVEYGLQSAHDETLRLINRGHDFACFEKTVNATKNRGISICAHVIIGLPNESREDVLKTADEIVRLGIDGVKIHLLYVIRNTPLEKFYRQKKYRPLSQAEYVDWVCGFLERIPKTMIVQRLTGDPHREELVAPQWALRKRETLRMIHEELEKRQAAVSG